MRKILITVGVILGLVTVNAQNEVVTSSLPFLTINSDARAGAMGDVGVATSSDAFSLYHNPAKIAFNKNALSLGVSYVPWLRNLTNDIFAGNLSVVNRMNEKSSWGADLKYFSLGRIDLTDNVGASTGVKNPSEFMLSGYYGMKLSQTYSMSIGLKYINSNLDVDDNLNAVNSFAVDVAGFYQSSEENYGSFNGLYRFGFNIANIGPKIEYTPGIENFIPTTLKLGGGFDFILDDFNMIGVNLETTKLLVPSDANSSDGWINGMATSFSDRGVSDLTLGIGAEYKYNNAFAVRAGYFNESEEVGQRQFMTLGAGFKARAFSLDLSYLMNTSNVNDPLENTLRFSLAFDFGEIYED